MNHWQLITRFLAIRLVIYLSAVVVAYVLAAGAATQSVVASLVGMGVDVDFAERVSMTLHNLLGMAGMFLPMVAFGLLIAFMAAALVCRYWSRARLPLYLAAGACALLCIHLGLHLAFGITPIAIARSTGGLIVQALAGAAGGGVYVLLSRSRFAQAS
jgi:hypothetical protein